jgi:hypothetical protein
MPTTFDGQPWLRFTDVCRGPGPRHIAIAYIGTDAPALMPLKRGDVLVCNAGREALLSHATSPDALQQYVDRGVKVFSDEDLHAKVIATKTTALVGSANASRNSQKLDEAVVITDSAAIVCQVREHVLRLAIPERRLCRSDLDYLRDVYASGTGRSAPKGTDAGRDLKSSPPFPRLRDARIYVTYGSTAPYTKAVEQAVADTKATVRKQAGPARDFVIEPLNESVAVSPQFRMNDVLVWIEYDEDSDDYLVWLCEVETYARVIGRSRLYWLRRPARRAPLRLTAVDHALRRVGHRHGLGGSDRWVRSPGLRQAILTAFSATSS